jgi:quinol monooxygenase YgiN
VSFVLVARIRSKPGNELRVASIFRELASASREEPGCELYIPTRDPEDGASFLIYEQYRDAEDLEDHRATEHFQRLAIGELYDLIESSERALSETI